MLAVTNMTRHTKFNVIVRNDPKSNDGVEVRIEGFDVVGVTLSPSQYNQLRRAIGKFTVSAPPPPPTPPASEDDGWSS